MRHIFRIGRIGGLVVGLGVGAALAATPGIAAAEPSSPLDPDLSVPVDAAMDGSQAHGSGGIFDFAFADEDTALAGTASIPDGPVGNFDFATPLGNISGVVEFGDLDRATTTGFDNDAYAIFGNDNHAFVVDNAASSALRAGATVGTIGSNEIASGFGDGSLAGVGGDEALATDGNFDFAGFLGDGLAASAIGGNGLVDIVP